MPTIRQTLTGLTPQTGPTAFMPLRAITPSGMDIKRSQGTPEGIVGQPGTQGIPAPYPDGPVRAIGARKGSYLPGGGPGYAAGSGYMPARWYPSLYWRAQHLYRAIGGVSVYSDNIMPMPAIDPRRLPSGVQGPVGFAAYKGLTPTSPARPQRWVIGLGQTQVQWPKRLPAWPPTWPAGRAPGT